jgi:hypothetical protein
MLFLVHRAEHDLQAAPVRGRRSVLCLAAAAHVFILLAIADQVDDAIPTVLRLLCMLRLLRLRAGALGRLAGLSLRAVGIALVVQQLPQGVEQRKADVLANECHCGWGKYRRHIGLLRLLCPPTLRTR